MDDFDIENGVLRFKSSPDFEDPQGGVGNNSIRYEVTVQASDGGADTTSTEQVTIEVTNVDEDGAVTLSTLQPQVDRAITATLDDPDNETASTVNWQWYRGSSPITSADDSAGMVTPSYTPTGGDVGSRLRATATYDDAEGEDKTAQDVSDRSVRGAPDTNTDPKFPDKNLNEGGIQTEQTRKVAENARTATNLGAPVEASDPGDVLTYSLSGTNAASFDINRATGQLITKALDFEDTNNPSDNEFEVTVTATDPFGVTATSDVTITVTDVNEDPSVMGAASIDHAENGTELDTDAETANVQAATYTATDADVDDVPADLKWTLSGADASKFSITDKGATGTLSFKEAPDYEVPWRLGREQRV